MWKAGKMKLLLLLTKREEGVNNYFLLNLLLDNEKKKKTASSCHFSQPSITQQWRAGRCTCLQVRHAHTYSNHMMKRLRASRPPARVTHAIKLQLQQPVISV